MQLQQEGAPAHLLVQGKAVRQDLLVGRHAADSSCRQQRRLKPAPVLITALHASSAEVTPCKFALCGCALS